MKPLLLALLISQAADAPLKDESGKEIVLQLNEEEVKTLATNIKTCEAKLETCKAEIKAAPSVPHWVWFTVAALAGVAVGVGAGYAVGQATK